MTTMLGSAEAARRCAPPPRAAIATLATATAASVPSISRLARVRIPVTSDIASGARRLCSAQHLVERLVTRAMWLRDGTDGGVEVHHPGSHVLHRAWLDRMQPGPGRQAIGI